MNRQSGHMPSTQGVDTMAKKSSKSITTTKHAAIAEADEPQTDATEEQAGQSDSSAQLPPTGAETLAASPAAPAETKNRKRSRGASHERAFRSLNVAIRSLHVAARFLAAYTTEYPSDANAVLTEIKGAEARLLLSVAKFGGAAAWVKKPTTTGNTKVSSTLVVGSKVRLRKPDNFEALIPDIAFTVDKIGGGRALIKSPLGESFVLSIRDLKLAA